MNTLPTVADYEVLHVRGKFRLRCLDQESCQSKARQCLNVTLQCYPTSSGSGRMLKTCFEKTVKLFKMLNSIKRVLKGVGRELPDCRLPLLLRSTGHESSQVACIARAKKHYGCFMVPNPYFEDLYKWEKSQERSDVENTPWEYKENNAFYRGACRIEYDKYGSMERFKLMSINSSLLDVGWTRNAGTAKCIHALTNDYKLQQHHLNRIKLRVKEDEFFKHKFLLNMPGSTRGSYSRHLQRLWNKGSIVLMWEADSQEWYYEHLVEGKTHITVNQSTLLPTLQHLLQLPAREREKLIMGAKVVFEKLLSKEAIALRWLEAFEFFCSGGSKQTFQDGYCSK